MSPALRLLLSGTQTACEAEPHAAFAGPRCVLQRPRRLPVVFSADSQCCLAGFGSGSSFFFSCLQPEAVLGCAESNAGLLLCLHTALGVSS